MSDSRSDGLDVVIVGGGMITHDQILPSISPNIGVYATEPMADPICPPLSTSEIT